MSTATKAELLAKWHELDQASFDAELNLNKAISAVTIARERRDAVENAAKNAYFAWRVAQDAPDPEVVKANQARVAAGD